MHRPLRGAHGEDCHAALALKMLRNEQCKHFRVYDSSTYGLAGVAAFTGQFRVQFEETCCLMRSSSPIVREAAGMLGFLDVGLGMSNMALALSLANGILDLVSKIGTPTQGTNAASISLPPPQA